MTFEEMKAFTEANAENEEVVKFLGSFKQEPNFDTLLENEDFKKKVDSIADSRSGKAVATYKEKGFKEAVEKEVKLREEAKNHKEPWEIKIEESDRKLAAVENMLAQKERDSLIATNKAKALTILSEKSLPTSIIDFVVSDEEDKTLANLDIISKTFEDFAQSIKKDMLKGNNTNVPSNTSANAASDDEYDFKKEMADKMEKIKK